MVEHILVPLDGSDLAEKALPHAQNLAKSSGATIHLIQVYDRESLNPARDQSVGSAMEQIRLYEEAQAAEVERYLERTAVPLKNDGINVETAIREGSPHENILDYASKNNIDIITMSTHGHGGFRRMLTGSVTDRVIRSSEIPVFVIPGG